MKGMLGALSKSELLFLMELSHEMISCDSRQAVEALVRRLVSWLPGCSALTVFLSGFGDSETANFELINLSYPKDWLNEYRREGYFQRDPIKHRIITSKSSQTTCIWSDVLQWRPHLSNDRFMSGLFDNGLSNGVTCSFKNQEQGTMSFMAIAGREVSLYEPGLMALEYISPYLHEAFTRVNAMEDKQKRNIVNLTLREREVLSWAKAGKTNSEISDLLNISERTVKFHVQNIFEKLNASTRTHAVAIALQQGLIAA